LDGYEWSSHREYDGLRRAAGWLCLDWLRYWGKTKAEAQEAYRKRMAEFFEAGEVASPWERLRGGLVLGGEDLWRRARQLVEAKSGQDEARWTRAVERERLRRRVEELLAEETDERVKIWMMVRMAGERNAVVGRRFGYRDGSAVRYILRRLGVEARQNATLDGKLRRLQDEIYRLQS
jgi:hypothetical protein